MLQIAMSNDLPPLFIMKRIYTELTISLNTADTCNDRANYNKLRKHSYFISWYCVYIHDVYIQHKIFTFLDNPFPVWQMVRDGRIEFFYCSSTQWIILSSTRIVGKVGKEVGVFISGAKEQESLSVVCII